MKVDGVNSVAVGEASHSSPVVDNNNIKSASNIGESESGKNKLPGGGGNNINSGEENIQSHSPEPIKSMSTADFLSLHNSYNHDNNDNVMNKMMKILEAVLALKLLDETLEAAQDSNNFEDIA